MTGNVSSSSGKSQAVSFTLRELSPPERRRLAFRSLGIFWGLSLVTLPLPPVHWVSVPGFFLYGIYAFVTRLREGRHFEPFSFPCPECAGTVQVPAQVVKNPLETVCPGCRYGLKLSWA